MRRGFGPPMGAIIGTFLTLIGWLVFIIVYALFWSKRFDLFQNVILTIGSLIIAGLIIGLIWIAWVRMRRFPRKWAETKPPPSGETKPPGTEGSAPEK